MRMLLSCLLASNLAAQAVVSPAFFAPVDGDTNENKPLGHASLPSRYLQIHDDMAGKPLTISQIAFRRDAFNTAAIAAFSVTMEAWMSNAATKSTTVDLAFPNNHGANFTRVLPPTQINFAATPAATALPPRAFAYAVPLTNTFGWNGNGGLCWEMLVTARSSTGTKEFDACSGTDAAPALLSQGFGAGCTATGRSSKMHLTVPGSASWSSGAVRFNYSLAAGPANSTAVFLLGGSETRFGSLVLPFELPGTATAVSGACQILASWDIAIATLPTNASGGASYQLVAPLYPSMHGVRLLHQAVASDPSANAFGLVTSDAVFHQVVAPWTTPVPVGTLYQYGAQTTATRRSSYGLVTQFR